MHENVISQVICGPVEFSAFLLRLGGANLAIENLVNLCVIGVNSDFSKSMHQLVLALLWLCWYLVDLSKSMHQCAVCLIRF